VTVPLSHPADLAAGRFDRHGPRKTGSFQRLIHRERHGRNDSTPVVGPGRLDARDPADKDEIRAAGQLFGGGRGLLCPRGEDHPCREENAEHAETFHGGIHEERSSDCLGSLKREFTGVTPGERAIRRQWDRIVSRGARSVESNGGFEHALRHREQTLNRPGVEEKEHLNCPNVQKKMLICQLIIFSLTFLVFDLADFGAAECTDFLSTVRASEGLPESGAIHT
jgi:hypothetical protein